MAIVVIMERLFYFLLYFFLLNIAIIAVIVIVMLSKRSKERAAEERLSYGNAELIRLIDEQLQGIDRRHIWSLTPLLYQRAAHEIRELLERGEVTHEELVAYYLLRIRDVDQSPSGSNAIIAVNPKAIEHARKLDLDAANVQSVEQSHTGQSTRKSPIYGLPVLLKDNINTCDMPTTAGSIALKDWIPAEDAPVVRKLRNAGAIILGKTNLSEMSFYMSKKAPNGYSAMKGQTLSPFVPLHVSAGGSSTGSAVAMATDLAALSYGTETIGSIVSPSSANSVVGLKPSRSPRNMSNRGVIPITTRMDTVGPITKCVRDAEMALRAAQEIPFENEIEWDVDFLRGKAVRIEKTETLDRYLEERLVNAFRSVGVYVAVVNGKQDYDAPKVLEADFEQCLDTYLEEHQAPIRSLKEWVEFNRQEPGRRMRYGQSYMEVAANKDRAEMLTESEIKQMIENAEGKVSGATHPRADAFDAMVFVGGGGAALACLAGAPEITLPFGVNGPFAAPVGVTLVGGLGDDQRLIKLAYSFEQLLGYRVIPN